MTPAESVKAAACGVEAQHAGAHVICVALLPSGEVVMFAKSDDINDVPALLRALRWFSKLAKKAAASAVPEEGGPPSGTGGWVAPKDGTTP